MRGGKRQHGHLGVVNAHHLRPCRSTPFKEGISCLLSTGKRQGRWELKKKETLGRLYLLLQKWTNCRDRKVETKRPFTLQEHIISGLI